MRRSLKLLFVLVLGTACAASPDPATTDATPAPDFTLELGDGTPYVLSADPLPVYLVFWAEW